MDYDQEQMDPAQALIPFTGYYALDDAAAAFVMVDTFSTWQQSEPINYQAKITVSPNGETSQVYVVGQGATYQDGQLVVTDQDGYTIAQVSFAPAVGGSTVQGTVEGVPVSGSTPFGPVYLGNWTGTYYLQGKLDPTEPMNYPYSPALRINGDGTVDFSLDGGPLEPVTSYWYDYGMFVVAPTVDGNQHLFEMGTSSGWGRVAGNATNGTMLVSIRLNEPAPHL